MFCETHQIHSIEELSPSAIRNYFIELEKRGHNRGGVFAHYKVLCAFLNWYRDENELIDWSNPIRKVKVKPPSSTPQDPADIESIKAILKTCKNDFYGIRDKAMLLVLLDTGLRASEALSLNIEDVNPINGII